jgi:DNA-binding HxlR family transcriptional regulator
MGDHPPSHGLPLHLLADKSVFEVLRMMAESDQGSTFEYVGRHGGKRTLRLLRSLAVEGLVGRCGTWDTAPTDTTVFALTARGYRLVAQLERLAEWAECRAREQDRQESKPSRWRC